jgi:hypothetical protein
MQASILADIIVGGDSYLPNSFYHDGVWKKQSFASRSMSWKSGAGTRL